jgi:hypothetical protein
VPDEHVAPAVTWHASGGVVQSEAVQQFAFGMQLFDALQTFCPDGQPQLPPAPEHCWPFTVQSALVQHVELPMHEFDAVQTFCPDGQPQLPPAPEHT